MHKHATIRQYLRIIMVICFNGFSINQRMISFQLWHRKKWLDSEKRQLMQYWVLIWASISWYAN